MKASVTKVELQKQKEPSASGHSGDDNRKDKDAHKLKDEENLVSQEGKEKDKPVENRDVVGSTEEEKNVVNKDQGGSSSAQNAAGAKPGKKKIIKRIVKKKIANKKDGGMEGATKQNDVLDKEDAGGENIISEVDGQKDGLSSNPPAIKTFIRKKIVRKPVHSVLEKDECTTPEVKTAKEPESAEDKTKVKLEAANLVEESGTKTTVKKKVVKRVPKRKAVSSDANSKAAEDDMKAGEKIIQLEQIKGKSDEAADDNQKNEIVSKDNNSPKIIPQIEKHDKREEKKGDNKELSGSVTETVSINRKVSQTDNVTKSNEKQELKDEKERKNNIEKNESKSKASKVVKEKRKSDEPPRHPGLFLQTKGSKDSKVG